jgi:hypothetical protein
MEVRCSVVSASPQLLLLMCPLKLPDANDLRQAGHCFVREVWLGGGSRGGDGDGWEGDGGRSWDSDDGAAASAARRGGISTARKCTSARSDDKSNNHRGRYRDLTRVGPWPNVDFRGSPQGSSHYPGAVEPDKSLLLNASKPKCCDSRSMVPRLRFPAVRQGVASKTIESKVRPEGGYQRDQRDQRETRERYQNQM